MKNYTSLAYNMKRNLIIINLLALFVVLPLQLSSQGDGPRFYWKTMTGMNAIPVIFSSLGGNANPIDPSLTIYPGSIFEASMAMPGYARIFPFLKRSAMASIILPMGRISGDVTFEGLSYNQTSRGFGDPMLQAGLNLIGKKAIMNIPDMLRYKPGFSLDIIGSLAIPIGEYNNDSPINIGQHRWYGRIGLPIVCQIGKWVPGKRTTLELLPAIWILGDNNDFVGKELETEPMYQLEAHITRDFMERMWGSLDVISYLGGAASIDGAKGNELSNLGMGGTLGYQVNDNMQLTIAYTSTVNDQNPEDLKMDGFRITLLYGWHSLIEGMKRLEGNE